MRNSSNARTWLSAAVVAAAIAASTPQSHGASPALEMARQLNSAFVEVADTAAPAVVFIQVEQKITPASGNMEDNPFFEMLPEEMQKRFKRRGQQQQPETPRSTKGNGSGFIISEDGYILTNNHVVEDADKITVILKDGREFKAEVRGTDPLSDLAVIKITGKGLKALKLADSTASKVGEFVIAIGAPFGLDHTVTVGHISAKGRAMPTGDYADQDFIQTDASINPGNSGGPLINLYGDVVGINSMIRGMNTGIGFAIPSSLAKQVSDSLIKNGKMTRSRIGVQIASLKDNQQFRELVEGVEEGVFISGVQTTGPAAKVLKPRDVVVAVDGKKVKASRELQEQIYYKTPGDTVTLDVVRDGKTTKLKVKTEAIPEQQADTKVSSRRPAPDAGNTSFGIRVEPITSELAKKLEVEKGEGVAVTSVDPSSVAAQRGIRAGDIITEVNRKPVNSPKDFREAMKGVDLKKGVFVNLIREGSTRFLNLKETEE